MAERSAGSRHRGALEAGHARAPGPAALHAPTAAVWLSCLLAACIPTLLALHQPPSATLLNQCLAVCGWGVVAAALAPPLAVRGQQAGPLQAALALVLLAALASWRLGSLPAGLAWQAAGLLAGAMVMVAAGVAASAQRVAVFTALATGLLAAGVAASLVALVQVFAPAWADGTWIAHSGVPGRAVGNLRQPNHLCSLLLWALAAAAALQQLGRLPRWALGLLVPLLVLAVELSGSRTGAVGLLLLAAWGIADRKLSRPVRLTLVALPLVYGLAWAAMWAYGSLSAQALGASARLAADGGLDGMGGAGSPNSRPNIWRNTLALIADSPWLGTGFGEFNLAWSMTAFDNRPTAFFDHCHNLVLQLLVELGLPLGGAVLAALAWALWRAARQAWQAGGADATAARAALVLVLLTGLHSMVEYPLWYAYFLLPAALAWGLLLGPPASTEAQAAVPATPGRAPQGPSLAGLACGLALAAGGTLAILDYQRSVVIYDPPDGGGSLATRIAAGQRSVLFAHHADYAAATNAVPPASRALGMVRAVHALLDTRLMIAWARHLAAAGRLDEARWVARRLADFRNPASEAFFAPCLQAPAAGAARPFQCDAPAKAVHWRTLAGLPPMVVATPAGLNAEAD